MCKLYFLGFPFRLCDPKSVSSLGSYICCVWTFNGEVLQHFGGLFLGPDVAICGGSYTLHLVMLIRWGIMGSVPTGKLPEKFTHGCHKSHFPSSMILGSSLKILHVE